jgi:thiamine-monophosphate kinase
LGCEISDTELPIHQDTYNTALEFNIDPTTCALNGGEDYELLFTIEPEDETKIMDDGVISIVGRMTKAEGGCVLVTKAGNRYPLKAQGWKHF